MHEPRIDRRTFLSRAAGAGGALALSSPLFALAERAGAAKGPGYGFLFPCRDRATDQVLLYLPRRFKCWSFGWAGDPMDDGTPTPNRHDGMAVVADLGRELVLVRNHEVLSDDGAFAPGAPVYDAAAGGGTTTVHFDVKSKQVTRAYASLTGTLMNCAGGPTPWGSWLSGEENDAGPDNVSGLPNLTEKHGYVFEVPGLGAATGQPLRDMGRFHHEACAVDPATGYVYETEDERTVTNAGGMPTRGSGFYRFVPSTPGNLAQGGALSMLGVVGEPQRDMDVAAEGDVFDVTWIPITAPDPEPFAGLAVFSEGLTGGGAAFNRLEGCWHGERDGLIYFIATAGGPASQGQVWAYDPGAEQVRLIVSSPNAGVLDGPDNVAASPRGGLLVCEDSGGTNFLQGVSPEGEVFRFGQNRVVLDGERGFADDFTGSEFAGATWSPGGNWLFVNVQTPGISFAIKGPWGRGDL